MDISKATAPAANSSTPTASATASATAGKSQPVDATGKTATASNSGESFTQVLGGQMVQDTSDEPTDAAVTLAGLMQMLQSLTLPIQNVLQTQSETKENQVQGLPEMLLQAMNSNDKLADKLLQDPNLVQWFQQAQEILSALSGKDSNSLAAPAAIKAAGASLNLQAQNTLLALTSMLKQQPNNVVLQHVAQDLQKVIQPILPQLVTSMNPVSPSLNNEVDASSIEPVENQLSANGLLGQAAPLKNGGTHAANKHTAAKLQIKTESDPNNVIIIQPTKSKLELLAAKNAVNAYLVAAPTASEAEIDLTPELGVDSASDSSPIVQFTDMLKAPLQSETAVKAAPQTMNTANFAQEMTEHVLKSMKITLEGGISEAKLSLFPKNLGHVDVRITIHEGQLVAQFAADTLAGKQMLESQLPQLRQSLQSQGLLVEKLEVTQNQNMQSGMFQEQRQQQSSNQTFRQNKSKSAANYDLDSVDFVQELSGAVQSKNTGYGNSFDVMA